MTFRQQHQSLLQFGGTLSLFRAKMTDEEKLARIDAAWEPDIRDNMEYWLMVAFATDDLPFTPIPFAEGGNVYKEDPIVTPMEFVDMLIEELNPDEAQAVLEEMAGNMFPPAYKTFRQILTRDLSKFHVDKELAAKITGMLG